LYQKPQINLARSTQARMWLLSSVCLLTALQSSLGDQFRSLALALCAAAGAALTEFLFNLKDRYFSIRDGSAVASGLVLALFLPNQLNPVFAFLGAALAMAVVKHSFGGLGSNWANPAACAVLFIRCAWPASFAAAVEKAPLFNLASSLEKGLRESAASPLAMLKISHWPVLPSDASLSSFLNGTVFPFFGTKLPEGYLTFFSAPGAGIVADRGLLCLVLGTMLLASSQCFRFWVPLLYLGVYCILVRIFGALPFGGGSFQGDVLFGLLSGGTIAAAFILATDPATGAKSAPGNIVCALCAGVFTFVFRFPGNEPLGAVPAVLLANAIAPLVRRAENKFWYERKRSE
jgi:electron transport complex protein RnfD